MKWKYACPSCRAILNPNVKIILRLRKGKYAGLMLLSPRPGNYWTICDEQVAGKIQQGQTVEFSCPVCHSVLTSRASSRLAEILLLRPAGEAKRVQFSRVFGERATFVVNGETVTPYGADAASYDQINFFGV
jgi:hypothetical protein